jgi:hypothetical protein
MIPIDRFFNKLVDIEAQKLLSGDFTEITTSESRIEELSNYIDIYSIAFTDNRFILYSQLVKICEKLNLYIGPISSTYGHEIADIPGFDYSKYFDQRFYLKPDKRTSLRHQYRSSSGNFDRVLYTVAPLNNFHKLGNEIIRNEIIKSNYSTLPFKLFSYLFHFRKKVFFLITNINSNDDVGIIFLNNKHFYYDND